MNSFFHFIYIIIFSLLLLKYSFVNLQHTEVHHSSGENVVLSTKYIESYEKMRIFPGTIIPRMYLKSPAGTYLFKEIFEISSENRYGESIDFIPDRILKDGAKIINNKQTTERIETLKEDNFHKKKLIISVDCMSNSDEKRRMVSNVRRSAKKRILVNQNKIITDGFSKLEKRCLSNNSTSAIQSFFMFDSKLVGNVCLKSTINEKKNLIKNFSYRNTNNDLILPPLYNFYLHQQGEQYKKTDDVEDILNNNYIIYNKTQKNGSEFIRKNSFSKLNKTKVRNWDEIMN